MIRAGLMRNVITIENATETKNSLNEHAIEWTPIAQNIRARKVLVRGNELSPGSGEFAQNTWQFEFRYFRGPTQASRIIENGDVFDIVEMNNVSEKNRKWVARCVHISRHTTQGL